MDTTRKKIVDIATQRFYEHGYFGTTMRDIAAGAEIQVGSIYNHFASKQDLLMHISLTATREMSAGAHREVSVHSDPEARLRAFVVWHVAFYTHHLQAARVAEEQLHALEPQNRQRIVNLRRLHAQFLRGLLESGQRELGWPEDDDAVIASTIGSMCTQVNTWYRHEIHLEPEKFGGIVTDFIMSGLKPR